MRVGNEIFETLGRFHTVQKLLADLSIEAGLLSRQTAGVACASGFVVGMYFDPRAEGESIGADALFERVRDLANASSEIADHLNDALAAMADSKEILNR